MLLISFAVTNEVPPVQSNQISEEAQMAGNAPLEGDADMFYQIDRKKTGTQALSTKASQSLKEETVLDSETKELEAQPESEADIKPQNTQPETESIQDKLKEKEGALMRQFEELERQLESEIAHRYIENRKREIERITNNSPFNPAVESSSSQGNTFTKPTKSRFNVHR